jgi:hypothetical protein
LIPWKLRALQVFTSSSGVPSWLKLVCFTSILYIAKNAGPEGCKLI